MLATGHPMENSLRWMRRSIVMILLLANFMTVILADAASTVTERHVATAQYSNIQASIDNIPARFSGYETRSNTPRFSISLP